jgi:3-phosphoshikimate 1-carboxyvinyltransferase
MDIRIFPPEELIEAEITLPLSKSVSARQLIINKLAGVETSVPVARCDDTDAMVAGLARTSGTVDVGAAGTAFRFLTAYFAATEGTDVVIDGSDRLRQRPISELVDALRALGAHIDYVGEDGHAPLHIVGTRLSGGAVSVNSSVSSQFISALMMTAPAMAEPLTINLDGEPVSMSYIKMTAEMMRRRGVDVNIEPMAIKIPNTPYNADEQPVEADWSAASYWYEMCAISAGFFTLKGITEHSLQGDSAVAKIAEKLGVMTEFDGDTAEVSISPEVFSRLDVDMSDTPDMVQTFAVAAAVLGVPFHFTGIKTLRSKETDRIDALARELHKLGVILEVDGDKSISWEGQRVPIYEAPAFDTYNDHRMAMAFAPVSVFVAGMIIRDAEVVSKSYPDFWRDMESAGFSIEQVTADAQSTDEEEVAQ